jgi:hypothetical protein
MKSFICFIVLCSIVLSQVSASRPSLLKIINSSGWKEQWKPVDKFLAASKNAIQKGAVPELSVGCALCGIAVNEVEGLLLENITISDIEKALQKDICSWLGGELKSICDDVADSLPAIVKMLEKTASVSYVCIELHLCAKPFGHHVDPAPVATYQVDLDKAPIDRWTHICSNSTYQKTAQFLTNTVNALLPNGGAGLEEIGNLLNEFYFPTEYAQEIIGCAKALGISSGWATLMNLGYEVSDACTSIVAQAPDGTILHSRNLDFWAGMGFTDSLKDMAFIVEFQKNKKTLFRTSTFAGYVGALSGMKDHAFSVTIDTRFYPGGLGELFYEVIAAIEERNASLVAFLSRDTLMNENDFESALSNLSNDELIADVYYILAGVSAGQGAVISRNRKNATNVWRLDSPQRWFEVETNYDHWEQPPWFDDRRVPANHAMQAMGQSHATLENMFKVMSTKPVLNLQTTYTYQAHPASGTYKTWTRWCQFPCVQ